MLTFVDLETARSAQRPCLVLLRGVPSPWSQAAKAIFELKNVDALAVWMNSGDPAVSAWTGMPNAPVALVPGEAPRSNWADILALAERLSPEPRLVPSAIEARVRMFGLSHELMGERGLIWSARLLAIDVSFATEGSRGFPLSAAKYLGARYGYQTGCRDGVLAAARASTSALAAQLARGDAEGGPHYFGTELTALDFYSAAVVDALVPLPQEQCAMHPKLRGAFQAMGEELGDALPPSLVAHRDRMHSRLMPLPMTL